MSEKDFIGMERAKNMKKTVQFDGMTRITIESQELIEKLVDTVDSLDDDTANEWTLEDGLEDKSGGVRSGLRPGELRVTCVLSDDQNDLLHAWAATSGRTFRQVTMAMADFYIENVIHKAVREGIKLKRDSEKEPPADYLKWYEPEFNDPYAEFFKKAER